MELVFLLIGVVLGAAIVAFAARSRLAEMRSQVASAEAKLEFAEKSREQLATTFEATVGRHFQSAQEHLLKQNAATQADQRRELERRQEAVAELVKPIREELAKVDERIALLDRDRRQAQGQLGEQLRTLATAHERLGANADALAQALRRPQGGGRWGELQLRRIVELAGMVEHCDFNEQQTLEGIDGRLRPDMVVNLPGGKHVVIDAKAPVEDLLAAMAADEDEHRVARLSAHARRVREHVRALGAKAYWEGLDSSPDVVVMFLPGEHFASAALQADPGLFEEAAKQRVLIATPVVLLMLLSSAAYGWQQDLLAAHAREIAELGRDLHGRVGTWVAHLEKVGKQLGGAVKSYNESVGSLERMVLPAARRLADHGAGAAGKDLAPVEPLDVAVRELTHRDEPIVRRLDAAS